MFVNDPPDHDEWLVFVDAFAGDLERRAVGGQVCDFAHARQIDIVPHQDRAAVLARGLNGARPKKPDLRSAIRTIRDALAYYGAYPDRAARCGERAPSSRQ